MTRDTRHSPLFKTPNHRAKALRRDDASITFMLLKILTAILCLILIVQLYHRRDWFRNIPDAALKETTKLAQDTLAANQPTPKAALPAPTVAPERPKAPAGPGLFTRLKNTFNPPKASVQDEIFALDGPLDTLFNRFGVDRNAVTRKIKNMPRYFIEEHVRLPKGRPLPEYVLDIQRLAQSKFLSLSDASESARDTSVTVEIWGRNKMVRRILLSYGRDYTPGFARMAFFLDDFGPNLSAEEIQAFAVIKRPMTVGVVPLSAGADRVCELARQNGFEVVCQIPMESVPYRALGDNALYKHFDVQKVKKILFDFSKSLPDARGYAVYGGGIRIVEDEPDILKTVLEFAKSENRYFIDNSFATRSQVAEFARTEGVECLDPLGIADKESDPAKIREAILKYAGVVKKTGKGLVLLHHGGKSASLLQQTLPALEEQGITVVTISSLFK